ncbi:MAG: DUF6134 family protein [Phenylobacterium sp.]|jgi:hypothetical protein|uniref:DUF6134 family protein n=1 Tax=Phenylobacterium sp. TaxID=1871053 RepID=UPI00391CD220
MPSPQLNRRSLLIIGLAAGATPWAAAAQASRTLVFDVTRNEARIGRHELRIVRSGDALTASSEVEMTIRVGPAPILRYRHSAVERWEGGRFASLETRTVTNGRTEWVAAQSSTGGVRIEAHAGARTIAAAAAPLTHWNQQVLTGPLFNPQNGKPLKIQARRVAPDRWELRGETEIDNWYDAAGDWAALRGKLPDGSTVRYRRA